jgi:hypothetical protein
VIESILIFLAETMASLLGAEEGAPELAWIDGAELAWIVGTKVAWIDGAGLALG